MVRFEFQQDAEEIAAVRARIPSLSALADFELRDLFWVPVRFTVGDAEIFGDVAQPGWQRLPLLGVALSFVGCPREALIQGRSESDPWEYGIGVVTFERFADTIVVYSQFTRQSGQAGYEELARACTEFTRHVRAYLLPLFPELWNYPNDEDLREWLRGEVDIPRWWEL